MFHTKFTAAVKRGIASVQAVYTQQKRAIDDRAERQLKATKDRYVRERIKADAERDKLRLQREMYQAKAAVKREQEAVDRAKRQAGITSFGEQASAFLSRTQKSFRQLQRGGGTSSRRRRTSTTKKRS